MRLPKSIHHLSYNNRSLHIIIYLQSTTYATWDTLTYIYQPTFLTSTSITYLHYTTILWTTIPYNYISFSTTFFTDDQQRVKITAIITNSYITRSLSYSYIRTTFFTYNYITTVIIYRNCIWLSTNINTVWFINMNTSTHII